VTDNTRLLSWSEAQALLELYGVAMNGETIVKADLTKLTKKYAFPHVLKGYSAFIAHKKEHGLVRLGINNAEELSEAYAELAALMKGWPGQNEIVLQPTAPQGIELVLGARRDQTFGPVLMFGLGGTLVEVLNEVVFAMAPLDVQAALAMLERWPRRRLLDGYRGWPAVNRPELAGLLVNLGNLINEHAEIQEIDLNPVIVGPNGLVLIDVRVTVENSSII
jgi:Acyl-CoA synthetase (NDP forming)